MAEFHFIDRGFGKYWVKLLHLERDGAKHSIKEYEVNTLITLDSEKDYKQVFLFKNNCHRRYRQHAALKNIKNIEYVSRVRNRLDGELFFLEFQLIFQL